jgi:hypothetical protein
MDRRVFSVFQEFRKSLIWKKGFILIPERDTPFSKDQHSIAPEEEAQ